MQEILKLGTRPSPLALRQAGEIQNLFSPLKFEVIVIRTQGDKDKITPLDEVSSPDFFTREIDQALLAEEIDLAVHSSKDLPTSLAPGLAAIFETNSISHYDVLVSKGNLNFANLPKGAKVGVSSQRRKQQLRLLRKDLNCVDIRGNIEERLALLDSGKIGALIVAHAAIIRLGLENRISEIFSLDIFPTHPKQGSLTIVAREADEDIIRLCRECLSQPNG